MLVLTTRSITLAALVIIGIIVAELGYLAAISDSSTRLTIVLALVAMGSSALTGLVTAIAHALGQNDVRNGNGLVKP